MGNNYRSITPAQRINLADLILTTIGMDVPNDYGVSDAQLTALTAKKTSLTTALQAQTDAIAAARAATLTKDTEDKALIDAIASIAGTVYGNPSVTPLMIQDLGLQPRDTERTPRLPVTPTDLVATPKVDGTVTLKWNRAGNAPGMSFVIEKQVGSDPWTIVVESTTRTRETLSGYTPGVQVSFRVRATRGEITSPASNVSTIYYTDPGVQLSLAA